MANKATSGDVIDALGGTSAVADLTGSKPSAVSNWRTFGAFPPKTYLVLIEALAAAKHEAPASLWGMKERATPEAAPEHERQAS
jgi:hypothetical protein